MQVQWKPLGGKGLKQNQNPLIEYIYFIITSKLFNEK